MAKQLQYESPKRDNPRSKPHRSDWIDVGNTSARQTLERRGWKIVAERDEPVQSELAPLAPLPSDTGGQRANGDTTPQPSFWEQAGLTTAQTDALIAAGFSDEDALRGATDDQLLGVQGIGPAAARNVRKALKASVQTEPESVEEPAADETPQE